MRRLVLTIILTLILAATARAQEETYKFDAGLSAGMSGYVGDASSNPFNSPGFYAAGTFRYLWNSRLAIRGLLSMYTLSGDTRDLDTYLPEDRQFTFKSTVTELSARFEFNFFPYGIGETYKRLKRWTPYIAAGIGAAMSSSDGDTFFAPCIPMAVGVKYKIKPRINLGIEFAMTKYFSDHIDSKELADLPGIKTSFLKNTDWTSAIALSITYEFGKRCVTCHYVD